MENKQLENKQLEYSQLEDKQFHLHVLSYSSLEALETDMAAFANTRGGVIHIGFTGEGAPAGVPDAQTARLRRFLDWGARRLRGAVQVAVSESVQPDGSVLFDVCVPECAKKPYFDRKGRVWCWRGKKRCQVRSRHEFLKRFISSFWKKPVKAKTGASKKEEGVLPSQSPAACEVQPQVCGVCTAAGMAALPEGTGASLLALPQHTGEGPIQAPGPSAEDAAASLTNHVRAARDNAAKAEGAGSAAACGRQDESAARVSPGSDALVAVRSVLGTSTESAPTGTQLAQTMPAAASIRMAGKISAKVGGAGSATACGRHDESATWVSPGSDALVEGCSASGMPVESARVGTQDLPAEPTGENIVAAAEPGAALLETPSMGDAPVEAATASARQTENALTGTQSAQTMPAAASTRMAGKISAGVGVTDTQDKTAMQDLAGVAAATPQDTGDHLQPTMETTLWSDLGKALSGASITSPGAAGSLHGEPGKTQLSESREACC